MTDALRTRVGGLPGRVPADQDTIGPRDGDPRRPQPTRTKCIVWSSRSQAIPGACNAKSTDSPPRRTRSG
jgi:hypothetical protein